MALIPLALGCDARPQAAITARAAPLSTFAEGGVMSADALRTGWYADEPLLDPALVGSSSFGPLFDAPVDGQVYAQPLYVNGALLVATETNHVYALDAATGATKWMRQLGLPWNAADLNCGDLFPTVGVTGTPAIDPATQTAYLFSKTYASGSSGAAMWTAHAFDLATGNERPGFPLAITGSAQNEPAQIFDATHQHQRAGLIFMNGVVYAAFGGHCDRPPYGGWVIGVSAKGVVTTMWSTEAGLARSDGGGIWMSGGGLVSDRDGDLLFATGNDASASATPIAGRTPPGALGEAIVRLRVQADGKLKAVDFFSPAELPWLNHIDADLGAGAPIGLPAGFGTPSHPNLLAHAGKAGELYLLDRDDLGGYLQGPAGSDRVLQRLGPIGNVWSRPSVWPGDGGYLYLPVVNGCADPADPAGCLRAYARGETADGTPALALSATSTSSFGYGSSAAIITSDGTRSGSALLWTIWASGGDSATSQLRAYDAVPEGTSLKLRFLSGVGGGNRFTAPGVGDGRVYVGTGDGHVLGFGITGGPPLRATGTAFAPTVVGDARVSSVDLTASGPVSVVALAATGDYALTPDAPSVPFTMEAGDTRAVPLTFRPTVEGPAEGALTVTTAQGTLTISLSGVGQSAVPRLTASPAVLAFAALTKGAVAAQTVSITNVGAEPVTISAVDVPSAPFAADELPAEGTTVPAGASFAVTVRFAPTVVGSAASSLAFTAGGSVSAVAIEGTAIAGPQLRLAPAQIDLGVQAVGVTVRAVFQLSNVGDAPVVIEKSKPPTSPVFQPETALPEGTVIAPGASSELVVRVSPNAVGRASDSWTINANDGQGVRQVSLAVTGYAPPVMPPVTTPASPDAGTSASSPSQPDSELAAQTRTEDGPVVGHACAVAGAAGAPGPAELALFGACAAATALARRRRRRQS
jgi:iron transport multicopper oxidase